MGRESRNFNSINSAVAGMATLFAVIVLSACTSAKGPQVVTVAADQYTLAFDAALEAARRDGLVPSLKDRRSGVIETETHAAGSLLEPWRVDNASIGQALENTFGYQRRRARFEFSRAGFQSGAAPGGHAGDSGPASSLEDLTHATGELELRVVVFVERANTPGVRRDTWSRRLTTRTQIQSADTAASGGDERSADEAAARRLEVVNLGAPFWLPVARDPAYERRLLATVERTLP